MRRRPPVDPQAARRFAFQTLAALAAERDSNQQYIHEAATAAHELGLTYADIGRALGLASSGAAWHVANDGTESPIRRPWGELPGINHMPGTTCLVLGSTAAGQIPFTGERLGPGSRC